MAKSAEPRPEARDAKTEKVSQDADDVVSTGLERTNKSKQRKEGLRRSRRASKVIDEKHVLMHKQEKVKDESMRAMVTTAIKKSAFCKDLEQKAAEKLCDAMDFFVFKGGETIVNEGDTGHYFFVCCEGELDVTVKGKAMNKIAPGNAFGAIALLYKCPRTATVVAKGRATAWGVDGTTFREIMKEHALKNQEKNRRFLDNVHSFDGLTAQQKESLGGVALYEETMETGTRVVTEGEVCNAIYFVKKGELKEVKGGDLENGKLSSSTTVQRLEAGDTFGEREVLQGGVCTSSIVADGACELVCIGVKELKEALGNNFITVLEQSFICSVLKNLPLFHHLSQAQRHKLAETMEISDYKESQEVGKEVRLAIVLNGELTGKNLEVTTLRRGQWWEDEALSGVEIETGEGGKKGPPKQLTAGSAGARLSVLTKDSLAVALRELGLSSITSSEQVIDYMRKMLLAKKVPIFRELSEDQVDSLVDNLVLKRYKQGAQVFRQGEVGSAFFVIASGEVKVLIDGNLVRNLAKGTCFGERALLFDERRSATVEVSSSTAELWSVDRQVFKEHVTASMRDELRHRIALQDTRVELTDLRHVRLIGAGAFGSVRLVEHKNTKVRYALKRVKKENGEVPPDVVQECALLASVDHPFILRMVRTFETGGSIYILTELITGGQLFEQTNERMGVLSRKQAQFYIGSLALILEALHGANIVYRDLKPENVMIDKQGFLKLVDFGLAKRLDEATSRTFTAVGTLLYMAPEVIRGHGYTFQVDVWSLGVMFYELVCGCLPFGEDTDDEPDILASILEDELEFPGRYNDQAGKKLIQALLKKQPEQRLGSGVNGWEEIKDNKFFKVGVSGNLFHKIIGRDVTPPVVPQGEQYSNEKELNESVTMSDSEELGKEAVADKVRDQVMVTFKKFDLNGDGTLNRAELARLLKVLDPKTFSDDNVDKLLNVVDTNGDGKIQFEEFLRWVAEDASDNAAAFRRVAELDIHV